MLQKYTLKHSEQSKRKVVKEFRDFLNIDSTSYFETTCEKSVILYMELVDENPDSDDTMMYITEKLLSELEYVDQHGYLIVIGDGKTYEHLMNIKRLYGGELHKVLIFPGDWHTLYNFQKVLMKAYYSAGLKQIANETGFRAETLRA